MGLKERSGSYVKFLIYLIVVILINVAATTLFFRIDLTANNIYNIDDMTGRVSNTISDGDATAPGAGNNATFNIWCDLLQDGAAHTFNGFDGNDTFNLNFDNNMGIPFSAGTSWLS